jgi:hypothetical protein
MPAAPDRACRWNDLEASWSFYSRKSVAGISNRKRLLIAASEAWKTINTRLGDGRSDVGNRQSDYRQLTMFLRWALIMRTIKCLKGIRWMPWR